MSVNSDSLTNVKLSGKEQSVASSMTDVQESQTSTLEPTVVGNTTSTTNFPTSLVAKLIAVYESAYSKRDIPSSLGPTGLE